MILRDAKKRFWPDSSFVRVADTETSSGGTSKTVAQSHAEIHMYSHHRRCGHGHSQQAAVAGWIAAKYRHDMLITVLCCHYTYKDKEEDLYTADATRIEEVLKVQPRISIVLSWTQQQHNLNRFMRQPIHPKLRQMLIVNVCVSGLREVPWWCLGRSRICCFFAGQGKGKVPNTAMVGNEASGIPRNTSSNSPKSNNLACIHNHIWLAAGKFTVFGTVFGQYFGTVFRQYSDSI